MRKPELPAREFAASQNKNVAKYREMNAILLRHRQGFLLYFGRELSQRVQIAGRSHASYC